MLARVLLTYAALSLATFLVYGWDKRQARLGGRRVPEARLHLLSLVGGFAGAWIGMRVFRHKTRKAVFHAVVLGALLLHGALWVWLRRP